MCSILTPFSAGAPIAVKNTNEMRPTDPPDPVASVERALRLLEAFRSDDMSVTLAELAERTTLYKSTILRLASTLEGFGYLVRSANGAYCIGPAPLRLAALYLRSTEPAERILPLLQRLVRGTGESASFSIRQKDAAICLYRVDSPQVVRDHVRPGDAHPLELGASGKVILAFSRPYEPRYARIRREVVAFASGELTADFASIAAPVFDATGVAGSLTVSGPSSRFGDKVVLKIKPALLAAAREASLALGADPSIIETTLDPVKGKRPGRSSRQPYCSSQ